MKKVLENDTELYIEVDIEELPLSVESTGKKLYVKLAKHDEPIDNLGQPLPVVWKDHAEAEFIFPK